MTGHTIAEILEIAEQELPRWRGTLERLAQWEQQHEDGPEMPRMNGRLLVQFIDDHPAHCRCQYDGATAFRGGMDWRPGDRVYRPSDFDTPPHEPRGRR